MAQEAVYIISMRGNMSAMLLHTHGVHSPSSPLCDGRQRAAPLTRRGLIDPFCLRALVMPGQRFCTLQHGGCRRYRVIVWRLVGKFKDGRRGSVQGGPLRRHPVRGSTEAGQLPHRSQVRHWVLWPARKVGVGCYSPSPADPAHPAWWMS